MKFGWGRGTTRGMPLALWAVALSATLSQRAAKRRSALRTEVLEPNPLRPIKKAPDGYLFHWLPFVDTYRTLCIACPAEVRALFGAIAGLDLMTG